jgi:tRNA threonylcarbamoyladenosine biosynthesis protein TsaB
MKLLGIETSGDVAGVAVADETGLAAELLFRHRMELSRFLAPRIQEVLALASIGVQELEGIAVSRGPGSYTGLRIGVTAAKSLAFARGLPIAAVSTLEALAWERPAPPQALVCPVLSASGTDLFAALYQWQGGRLEARLEEMLLPTGDLVERLRSTSLDVLLCGPG